MNSSTPPTDGVRLQKVLAAAGYGSRRKCEELIDEGRVSVNGQQVLNQGMRVDPRSDVVRVDGERVAAPQDSIVLLLNKPTGYITTMTDDQGRPCVGDIVKNQARLFHVGRLDADTSGALLLTNDGDLAHRLTHPSFGVEKRYIAEVRGTVNSGDLKRIKSGIVIDGTAVDVGRVRIRDTNAGKSVVEMVIHEGRNRIVRRLFGELGYPVVALIRTQFGPIELGNLGLGNTRILTPEEVSSLYDASDPAGA